MNMSTGITQAILCVALLSGLSSCIYQYYLIQEKMTWNDAQKYCREKYTDLASADSIHDMQQMIASVSSGYIGSVWTGLYDNFWDWSWSMPDDGIYAKAHQILRDTCSYMKQWHGTKLEITAGCTTQTWPVLGMKWRVQRSRSGTSEILVSVGLYRPTWMWWSDGIMLSFKYWQSNQPSTTNAVCAASRISPAMLGMWFDAPCDTLYHFMCHKRKQKFYLKLTALKVTGDLNDPVVMEAILKMIQKNMNDKGVLGDFKIVWKTGPDGKIFHAEEKKASLEKTDV
ncbi:uncharacterized protein LOC115797559 isoform X2 [Archocentrus centrarchus]|uniref:uncharacterized protein LOC115797559 isoform X2 n=1 Tax=Archocentrus centrarchus TaxID=63155 RepID=UPI0011EA4810|nr:uncharacterized protein LOC115797559 isoform X2 [Archocentrus centrarchus]